MVLRASALPQSFRSALAQIVPAERCFSFGNRVPENRLFVCCLALLEAGQLEVDGTGYCRSTLNENIFQGCHLDGGRLRRSFCLERGS